MATHDTCAGSDVVVMAANLPYRRWATELVSLVDNAHDRAVAETVAHLRGAQPP